MCCQLEEIISACYDRLIRFRNDRATLIKGLIIFKNGLLRWEYSQLRRVLIRSIK